MRMTVNSRRPLAGFELVEPLEPRALFAADPYTLLSSTAMTGAKGTGTQPAGLVMAPNGDLYGTTVAGGKHRYGAVFKISGSEHTLTTVATFDGTNGISPRGGLVLDADGDLFGTATGGGTKHDGVVWEITAASLASTASTITVVYSFSGPDGAFPISGLFPDGSGNFFGYTLGSKGSAKFRAVVFEVSPSGSESSLTTVAMFDKQTLPSGGLTIDGSGNIYGETRNGGNRKFGTVFRIDAGTSMITTLATFTGPNGGIPDGTLVVDGSGTIFGTTLAGGKNDQGTVFEISGTGPTLTTLFSFSGTNGRRPIGTLVLDESGNLFGVTAGGGGTNGRGVLFELSPTGTTETYTPLFHFVGARTGTGPTGPLIMNSSGQFFGTTLGGGGHPNLGSVFELAPNVT